MLQEYKKKILTKLMKGQQILVLKNFFERRDDIIGKRLPDYSNSSPIVTFLLCLLYMHLGRNLLFFFFLAKHNRYIQVFVIRDMFCWFYFLEPCSMVVLP